MKTLHDGRQIKWQRQTWRRWIVTIWRPGEREAKIAAQAQGDIAAALVNLLGVAAKRHPSYRAGSGIHLPWNYMGR